MKNEMSDAEFMLYQKLIYDTCGINLTLTKKQLLITRLGKRMNALNIHSFQAYREYVEKEKTKQELSKMINAISTNKTDFFREFTHFDFLEKQVYPLLSHHHTIRIWSAGCSSGEEPFTIAMTLLEQANFKKHDIKILATDISTTVLDEAESGTYSSEKIKQIPEHLRRKYFLEGTNQWTGWYQVKDSLKELIYFRFLNLMEPFPLSIHFDLIFCRNVMIYFDKQTQASLIEKFRQQLKPSGYLLVGHSESLSGIRTNLKYIQPTIYQKIV